jgi:hypothetical protein
MRSIYDGVALLFHTTTVKGAGATKGIKGLTWRKYSTAISQLPHNFAAVFTKNALADRAIRAGAKP